MIFETHAHYDDEAFDEDRDELIRQLFNEDIECVVNVCSDLDSIDKSIELSKKYDKIYCALGIHPCNSGELTDSSLSSIADKCSYEKVLAIGEIGLDYYWDTPSRDIQKDWFKRQIAMARELKLPVIIHSREAALDTYEILRDCKAGEVGGIIHCYSYTKEMAERFLEMDFHFGIGGVVTYKNSRKLVEAVEYIPMERIVLETDCPYLSPEPNRGKRNSSLNLRYIAQKIGEIKGLDTAEVIRITEENAKRLFFK